MWKLCIIILLFLIELQLTLSNYIHRDNRTKLDTIIENTTLGTPTIDIKRYSPVSEVEQPLLDKMSKEGYSLVTVTTEKGKPFYYFQKIVYKKE